MAATTGGPGNVQKGIERTGYADFWSLQAQCAPARNENYVPIIIALTLIAQRCGALQHSVEPEAAVPTTS